MGTDKPTTTPAPRHTHGCTHIHTEAWHLPFNLPQKENTRCLVSAPSALPLSPRTLRQTRHTYSSADCLCLPGKPAPRERECPAWTLWEFHTERALPASRPVACSNLLGSAPPQTRPLAALSESTLLHPGSPQEAEGPALTLSLRYGDVCFHPHLWENQDQQQGQEARHAFHSWTCM